MKFGPALSIRLDGSWGSWGRKGPPHLQLQQAYLTLGVPTWEKSCRWLAQASFFGPWNKHWEHWDESLLIKWLCVDDINCWVVILQGIVCLMFMIVGLIDWVDFSAVAKYLIIIHQPRVSFFSWTPIYGIQISSIFFPFSCPKHPILFESFFKNDFLEFLLFLQHAFTDGFLFILLTQLFAQEGEKLQPPATDWYHCGN